MTLPEKTPERQVHEVVGQLIGVLESLPPDLQVTALECFVQLYKAPSAIPSSVAPSSSGTSLIPRVENPPQSANRPGQLADFFSIISPVKDWEKALAVALWVQQGGDAEGFTARSISRELDHLGHGVSNITHTLNSLIQKNFVMQTRKAGKSQQARKLYRLTSAGISYFDVRLMAEKE